MISGAILPFEIFSNQSKNVCRFGFYFHNDDVEFNNNRWCLYISNFLLKIGQIYSKLHCDKNVIKIDKFCRVLIITNESNRNSIIVVLCVSSFLFYFILFYILFRYDVARRSHLHRIHRENYR